MGARRSARQTGRQRAGGAQDKTGAKSLQKAVAQAERAAAAFRHTPQKKRDRIAELEEKAATADGGAALQ